MNLKAFALAAIIGLSVPAISVIQTQVAQADTVCGVREPEVSFETGNYWVYICNQNGQLYYLGQEKNSTNSIRIPAFQNGQESYTARNGNTEYLVNSGYLEVWQNGSQILAEPVLNIYHASNNNNQIDNYEVGYDKGYQIGLSQGKDFLRYNYGYHPDKAFIFSGSDQPNFNRGYREGFYAGFEAGYNGWTGEDPATMCDPTREPC